MTLEDAGFLHDWVALANVEGLGGVRIAALLERFGDPRTVLAATEHDLCDVRGIGGRIARAIGAVDVSLVAAKIARWQDEGVSIVLPKHEAYPERLRPLPDAPPVLYRLGSFDLSLFNGARPPRAFAIVGTRTPTAAARERAGKIAFTLALRGAIIISGMAEGIDTAAHLGALAASGGRTLAVLGGGVLRPFPPTNGLLSMTIRARGALVSEIAPDSPTRTPGLIARNRLIAALCPPGTGSIPPYSTLSLTKLAFGAAPPGIIVVETEADGGAMYAARAAFASGRPVYAVENRTSGYTALLAMGAVGIVMSDE